MKVALVHDWLTGMRGGEKALEVLCERFPEAELFTLVHVPGSVSPAIERLRIHTSFVQRLPLVKRLYRHYLPLFPTAIEQFDVQTRGTLMWAFDEGWHEAEYDPAVGVWRWTSEAATFLVAEARSPVAVTLGVEPPRAGLGRVVLERASM